MTTWTRTARPATCALHLLPTSTCIAPPADGTSASHALQRQALYMGALAHQCQLQLGGSQGQGPLTSAGTLHAG